MAASADALLLFVPVAGDAPAFSGAGASSEGRDWRGRKTMEKTMRVLTINELMRLTRTELCGLYSQITNQLIKLPEGSPDRGTALNNIANIRAALARRDFSP
ncbi:MAG: hypothetical protein WAL80_15325 [Xanthobacteraceae bacterium]